MSPRSCVLFLITRQRIEAHQNAVRFYKMNITDFDEAIDLALCQFGENGAHVRRCHLSHALARGTKVFKPFAPATVCHCFVYFYFELGFLGHREFLVSLTVRVYNEPAIRTLHL